MKPSLEVPIFLSQNIFFWNKTLVYSVKSNLELLFLFVLFDL